jgi:glycosyltransferase involved in cell wall biosynthesis
VCLVGPSLDAVGGQSVQLQHLLVHLRDDPTLDVSVCAANPAFPRSLALVAGIPYLRTVVRSILYVITLVGALRRVDVVHAFSASYWSFVVGPLPAIVVGRLYGKGVILNYHSGEAEDHLRRWRRTAVPAMKLAHSIVVPSQYLVDIFAQHALHARAISNVIDAEAIPYRLRSRPRPVFLSNRSLEGLYNVSCVIRAFARIQREVTESRLIVAGTGTERTKLEALSRSLTLRNVEFCGAVSPNEMGALYSQADVYLNASNIDNMPLSLLEAFAAGLPVVTTDAGGIPYIVTHEKTGLLVPRDDDEALAAAALRLLHEDGLASRLAAAARAECVSKYVWNAVGREWRRAYDDADARARGTPDERGAPT